MATAAPPQPASTSGSPAAGAGAGGAAAAAGGAAVAGKAAKKRGLPILALGAGLTSAVLLGGAATWYLTLPVPEQPADKFAEALKLIDQNRPVEARELAKELEVQGYRDENFGGGVEYILGMAAFELAEQRHEFDPRPSYAQAATYLKEADRRALDLDRRPQWSFALGKSLHELGELSTAKPLLEEAYDSFPPRKVEAAQLLTDLYLDPSWKSTELLERALILNDQVLKATETFPSQQDSALLQRAEVLLALGRANDAEITIARVSAAQATQQGTLVLKARILISEGRFADAITELTPVAVDSPLDRTFPQQAFFLLGYASDLEARRAMPAGLESVQQSEWAAQRADFRQRAIEYLQKTINRYERSSEGVAAYVLLSRLQQEEGAHEKAIQSVGAALRTVRRPEDFRNRWMSLEQFRQRVLAIWTTWLEGQRYAEAISLSELMTPLFPRDQAYELSARAQQRWAEMIEQELNAATATIRTARQEELRRHWRNSGAAWARLATTRQASADYPEALWTSAEHYRRGQDFETALAQLDRFLKEPSEAMRPVALVRRGQVLLDLDRCEEAASEFQSVVRSAPANPAAFTAQYLLGVCRLEQDRSADAAAAWQAMLNSDRLSPSATEWREALLALGKLQTDLASLDQRQAESRVSNPKVSVDEAWQSLQLRSSEAIRLLEEYLVRYPEASSFAEAQYYLAKALQLQALWWQRQLSAAETDNARQQAQRQRDKAYERALHHFVRLRDGLSQQAQLDRLDTLAQQILANVAFELAHTLYALGRFDEAVTGYTNAANRYPQDVRVLVAYVQMARCYQQLGRQIEARSMLEQAKLIIEQQQIPDSAFKAATTSLTKSEWEAWLERVRQVQR